MRWPIVLLVGVLLPFSGCLSSDSTPQVEDEPKLEAPVERPALPANITDSKDITAGVEFVSFFGVADRCSLPTSTCPEYKFTIPANATNASIAVELTWTLEANGWGVYVMKGTKDVAGSTDPPPNMKQTLEYTFKESGDYKILVVPYLVSKDTYTLSAKFAYKEAGTALSESK